MNFNFLSSRRFWALVVMAIIGVLETEGIIPDEIAKGLITILAGFTVIRTIDRFSENLGKESPYLY